MDRYPNISEHAKGEVGEVLDFMPVIEGAQLGNFPQAFTHLSLINSALTLNRELDRRAAHPEQTAAIEQLIAST